MSLLTFSNSSARGAVGSARRRASWRCLLVSLASFALLAPNASADEPLDEFAGLRFIAERNIFDPARSSRLEGAPVERPKSKRSETLTLVGTMAYEKGAYAFFEGSEPQFHKVLETGGEIGDCTIAVIACSAVTLDAGTRSITLPVGMQMRREENGDWERADSSAPPLDSPSASTVEESDIVKRLMLQREQELK